MNDEAEAVEADDDYTPDAADLVSPMEELAACREALKAANDLAFLVWTQSDSPDHASKAHDLLMRLEVLFPPPAAQAGPLLGAGASSSPEGQTTLAIDNLRSVIHDWEGSEGRPDINAHRSLDVLTAALTAAEAATAEARRLLAALFIARAPQCQPFDDLLGVVSQIDNLLTGLVPKEDRDAALRDLSAARGLLRRYVGQVRCCEGVDFIDQVGAHGSDHWTEDDAKAMAAVLVMPAAS